MSSNKSKDDSKTLLQTDTPSCRACDGSDSGRTHPRRRRQYRPRPGNHQFQQRSDLHTNSADLCYLCWHFAMRAIRADWIRIQFPNGATNIQNTLRLGAGVVPRLVDVLLATSISRSRPYCSKIVSTPKTPCTRKSGPAIERPVFWPLDGVDPLLQREVMDCWKHRLSRFQSR